MHKQSRTVRVYFVLFLALFVLLTGCKGAQQVSASTPEPTATPTAAPTATPEPTASPTPDHKIYPITFGLSNELPYQNEYFNISIDLDDLWFAEPKGQMDLFNEFATEIPKELREAEYQKRLNTNNMIYDFYAQTHTGLQTVQVSVADHTMMQGIFPKIEDYLKGLMNSVMDDFREENTRFVSGKLGTIEIAGERQPCWKYSIEKDGILTHSAYVMLLKEDYILGIFVTSLITDHVDEVLASIHPIS